MNRKKFIYSISFIVLLLDQLIKLVVMNNMKLHQEIKIIPNFFSLYYVENPGAAFSILGNQTLFLIIVSVICLILIKEYIKKEKELSNLAIISLGMIVGGTIGNLFDRILYKAVIDYLAFDIFEYSFPVFNLADIAITVGSLLLLLSYSIENLQKNKSRDNWKKEYSMLNLKWIVRREYGKRLQSKKC